MPVLCEEPLDQSVTVGFRILISLYRFIDNDFIDLWKGVRGHIEPSLGERLETHLSHTVPTLLECADAQAIEICVTQQWLRAMVWQLYTRYTPICSPSNDNVVLPMYLVQVSSELLTAMILYPRREIEIHGVSLVSPAERQPPKILTGPSARNTIV